MPRWHCFESLELSLTCLLRQMLSFIHNTCHKSYLIQFLKLCPYLARAVNSSSQQGAATLMQPSWTQLQGRPRKTRAVHSYEEAGTISSVLWTQEIAKGHGVAQSSSSYMTMTMTMMMTITPTVVSTAEYKLQSSATYRCCINNSAASSLASS